MRERLLHTPDGVRDLINGEYQNYSNKALTQNGLILVPLREVFETLGAEVSWNEPTKSIEILEVKNG